MSPEWKPETEVIKRHDDLYATAWEVEYGKPIFDRYLKEPDNPNSPKITVRHDLAKRVPFQVTHEKVPHKFAPKQRDFMT